MRATLLFLPLLAACAMPELDVPESEAAARADWPELVPFGDVTDRAAEMPEPDPELGPGLDARADALRDRAAEMSDAPAPDGSADADRADRLRQRAEGLR